MVKNVKGGSRHKKLARKNVNAENVREKTRFANPDEPCEMYANVIKIYGGGTCEVMCNDGKSRMCVIRKKFRGRNKRGNIVQIDTKVLVGLRDWEVCGVGKKEKCDLLEVYKREQHSDLQRDTTINWKYMRSINEDPLEKAVDDAFDFAFGEEEGDKEDGFAFGEEGDEEGDEEDEDEEDTINKVISYPKEEKISKNVGDINIDDI